MGYYSTLTEHSEVKTLRMTQEEFDKKWQEFCNSKDGDDKSYLEQYRWCLNEKDPDASFFYIDMDEWYSKHYADEALAEFISEVIVDGSHCIIEFLGDDGPWGYYITKGMVKNIGYVKMVDGERIDK